MLGYDIFNLSEVVLEYIFDMGIKKGEKVDYAILSDKKPIIIVECKHHLENLNNYTGQLYRYFSVMPAKFAILTNGVQYYFYTDLDETNKLDTKPFLTIDLENFKNSPVSELEKFSKEKFDSENIFNSAV